MDMEEYAEYKKDYGVPPKKDLEFDFDKEQMLVRMTVGNYGRYSKDLKSKYI